MSAQNPLKFTKPIEPLPYNPFILPHIPEHEEKIDPADGKRKKIKINSFWFWQRWRYWRKKRYTRSQIFLHYLVFIPEFLLHHFFVLSGSMRIYLIGFFILFGGTFYAVAPTMALGCAFFFVSILISIGLANISRTINYTVDETDRIKQEDLHNFNKTYGLVNPEDLKGESKLSETPGGLQHETWKRIEEMEERNGTFSWLNYKHVLEKTNYKFVIYFMDIVVVIAAVWNITEEFLRWQAVLPFAATLTAMGPFWIIFTLAALAAVCLLLKMAYTYPVSKLRIKNAQLFQETRDIFEKAVKENELLELAIREIEEAKYKKAKENATDKESKESEEEGHKKEDSKDLENREARLTEQVKKESLTQYIFASFNKNSVIAGAMLLGSTAALGMYFLVISTGAPLWSSIIVPLLCFPLAFYISYHSLKWAIIKYNTAIHNKKSGKTFFEQFKDFILSITKNFESEKVLEDLATYEEAKELEIASHWKLLASLGVSALLTVCINVALPASLGLWPIILILALAALVITALLYQILNLVIVHYNRRKEDQNKKSNIAKEHRKEIEKAVVQTLKAHLNPSQEKKEQDQQQSDNQVEQKDQAQPDPDSELKALASLAYSLWKFKNMRHFKPRRSLLGSFSDNICVPLWNGAVTILPTFFIINGICVYVFLLPSVLACWPLFVIELVPAIALAIIFGLWKLGDNEHDLIRDAASKIFDEIINEKHGKLNPFKDPHSKIKLRDLGLIAKVSIKEERGGDEISSDELTINRRISRNPVSLPTSPLPEYSPKSASKISLMTMTGSSSASIPT